MIGNLDRKSMIAVQLAIARGGAIFGVVNPEGKQGMGTPGGASIDMIVKAINFSIH